MNVLLSIISVRKYLINMHFVVYEMVNTPFAFMFMCNNCINSSSNGSRK